jgi:hypothetical protein
MSVQKFAQSIPIVFEKRSPFCPEWKLQTAVDQEHQGDEDIDGL